MGIDETARIESSTIAEADTQIREYVTVHDSEIAAGVRIYERTSIKKSSIAGPTDINANSYIENADIGERVQIGPNCSVVGVTHDLDDEGMTFREDTFERVVLEDGAFVGAGATVLPGITIGENAVVGAGVTVSEDVAPGDVVRE